jgi:DNA-binding NtrC family response regulator
VVEITMPPLRRRQDDIPLLAQKFLADYAQETGRDLAGFTPEALALLRGHDWPGNIRELRNSIERLTLMDTADPLSAHDTTRRGGAAEMMPPPVAADGQSSLPVRYELPFKDAKETLIAAFEKEYLTRLLARTERNIARAAREAGIDRKHLYTLLAKHGLASSEEA